MSLATTPTAAITSTPRFDRIVADRWEHWEAATTIWMRHTQFSYATAGDSPRYRACTLNTLQGTHRQRLAELLSRGIPLRVIRRLALDDPRATRSAMQAKANDYLQRRLQRSTKEPSQ